MNNKVKLIERGWQGHLCVICLYHRNTLLEYEDKKIIVSTVGHYRDPNGIVVSISGNNYYETKVFEAQLEKGYWDMNIAREVYPDSNWRIPDHNYDADLKAEEMHNKIVKEMTQKLLKNKIEFYERAGE